MLLGFTTHLKGQPTHFVEQILDGRKVHTLRQDQYRRWKSGRSIQFATGVRTKQFTKFKEDFCTAIQDVYMSLDECRKIHISIDQTYLYYDDMVELAKNDGFNSLTAFVEWFEPLIRQAVKEGKHGLRLRLIHWTDKRY